MPATLTRLRAGDPLEKIVSALQADGAVIVEEMLAPDTVARLNAELDPHLEAADPAMPHVNPVVGAFFGTRTRHVAALASKSRTFVDHVLCHPLLDGVCAQVLGPSCARWQLNVGHLLDRGPGAEAQWPHRDEDVWIHVPRPHPTLQVASMTALGDFSAELGATRLVPGSHRWPRERQPGDDEWAVAAMPAGASVLYLGSVIHQAGTNATPDRRRRGLHLSFVLGWLRTEENNYLATPPAIARELPLRARELLGYPVHDAIESGGGYLGMVELRDPGELLERGELG